MTTYTVGKGMQFATIAAAVAATQDGDTVLVNAGTYTNDNFTTYHKITLQSVGGMAILSDTTPPPNGKGIITSETDLTVIGFGFTGASVGDNNGAGIRYEGGNLTIQNSLFWNNQEGILATPLTLGTGTVTITGSEFNHNGAGDGYSHNIYIGDVASLNIDNSYFHDAVAGHEIKSRAQATTITNTRIQDNATGTASYDVDLPDGGVNVLDNDTIEKGPNTSNPVSIHMGGDGTQYANASLTVTHSTLINDRPGATLLLNQTPGTAVFSNDSIYGYATANLAIGNSTFTNNATLAARPPLDTNFPVSLATMFDPNYYLAQNPDVKASGMDPLVHFETYGWKEGRQPSLMFDDGKYLSTYKDVAAAGMDPLLHYITFGQKEGRATFLTGGTAAADPLVNATYYDTQLGATLIPAGTAGAQQAAWSYDATGWQKGLNPDAFFNTSYYLANNPDVAAAHVDPLLHYETYGWKEGRNPSASFSTNKYLAANPDVKAAGIDPLLHYVVSGINEGRPIYSV